jgi:hypothetical protein
MTIARYYVRRASNGASSLIFTCDASWQMVAIRGCTGTGVRLDPISLAINTTLHIATLASNTKDYTYEIVFSTDAITNAMLDPGGVLYPFGQDMCPSRLISITPNAGFLVDGDPPPPPPEVTFCLPAKNV